MIFPLIKFKFRRVHGIFQTNRLLNGWVLIFFFQKWSLLNFSFGLPDYYAILGVSRAATQREIKSAYYKLSKKVENFKFSWFSPFSNFFFEFQYHPDVTGNNKEAQAKFIQVTEAYETLKDPDRYGKGWD